jgi:cyclohexanone monooxygenase
VTDPIERITKRGVLTADGRERELDTLVFASGFSATKFLSAIDVRGRGGRSIDEAWSEGAQAYLGITTAGFPNLFMLYGPNTNNGSILEMIECQVEHVIQHVLRMADEDLAWVDARPEVEARYNEEVQQAMAKVEVWNAGCNGYYRTPSGRIVTQYPFTMSEFKRRTAKPDPADFEVERQGNRR